MPLSAMPEHINSPEKIDAAFPDDEQFGTKTWYGRLYRWYQKKTKTWFAFSYRSTEWWAKTRMYPMILFAVRGNGLWRFEPEVDSYLSTTARAISKWQPSYSYLSRVQYYCRWHFAVQLAVWDKIPLVVPMVSFHWYPKAADVPIYGQPRPPLKGKVWFGYWNHFDADMIHWLVTSAFFGNTWK